MYLKRYYWVAILGCIATSSALVAGTANTFVSTSLEPAPLLGLDQAMRAGFGPQTSQLTVDVERFGHLFGIEPPPPPVPIPGGGGPGGGDPTPPPPPSAICFTCEPVKTGLRLQLLATMVSSDKHFSTALISDLDKMETGLFHVDDTIKNADVYDIVRDPHRVIIVNNDTHKLEYIDEIPGTGATAVGLSGLGVAPVPPPDGEATPVSNTEGIKRISDTQYEISKTKLDSTLGDLNKVATQARIVPSFKNGQANGFKLFSIQPDSIYSAIGVQNGDVITSINGLDINSPEKALEAYTRLKDSQNFDIVLDRRGSTVKMNYGVR